MRIYLINTEGYEGAPETVLAIHSGNGDGNAIQNITALLLYNIKNTQYS